MVELFDSRSDLRVDNAMHGLTLLGVGEPHRAAVAAPPQSTRNLGRDGEDERRILSGDNRKHKTASKAYPVCFCASTCS